MTDDEFDRAVDTAVERDTGIKVTDTTGIPLHVQYPEVEIAHFFEYDHLPPQLQSVSHWFHGAASFVLARLPASAERTVALRKLLEAKDAAVRAQLLGDIRAKAKGDTNG